MSRVWNLHKKWRCSMCLKIVWRRNALSGNNATSGYDSASFFHGKEMSPYLTYCRIAACIILLREL